MILKVEWSIVLNQSVLRKNLICFKISTNWYNVPFCWNTVARLKCISKEHIDKAIDIFINNLTDDSDEEKCFLSFFRKLK